MLMPKILDSSGRAELSTRTNPQLTMSLVNGVALAVGRMALKNDRAYNPTVEAATRYPIRVNEEA